MPQQQNKLAPVRGETTVPRHHNEPLVTSHKNRDSENHRSEFLAKVRKMAKNEIIFSQSEETIHFGIKFPGIKWHFLHHKLKVFSLPPQRIALIFAPHDAPHLVTRSHTHHFHFYSLFIFTQKIWSLLWVTLKKSEKCFG